MHFMKLRHFLYEKPVCLFIFLALFCFSTCFGQQDSNEIKKIFFSRPEKLSNLIVSYRETIKHQPLSQLGLPAVQKMGSGYSVIDSGTEIYDREYSFLNGLSLYKNTLVSIKREVELPFELAEKISDMTVFLNDRVELYRKSQGKKSGRVSGEIRNWMRLPRSALEVALALRFPSYNQRLHPGLIKETRLDFPDEEHAKLTIIDVNNISYEYVLSRKFGYAPIAFVLHRRKGNGIVQQMEMSEFKNVDGLMLPSKIDVQNFYYKDEQRYKRMSQNIVVKEYRLNDPGNVPDRYRIDWPENTRIVDSRSGSPISSRAVP